MERSVSPLSSEGCNAADPIVIPALNFASDLRRHRLTFS
jgi:hypothetical protein